MAWVPPRRPEPLIRPHRIHHHSRLFQIHQRFRKSLAGLCEKFSGPWIWNFMVLIKMNDQGRNLAMCRAGTPI
jgi:hypothetical protein